MVRMGRQGMGARMRDDGRGKRRIAWQEHEVTGRGCHGAESYWRSSWLKTIEVNVRAEVTERVLALFGE